MTSQLTAAKSFNPMRMFANFKIATKIAVGFACVLVIMAVSSSISYFSFLKVDHGFDDFNQRVGVAGLARTIDREFGSMRRYVLAFAVNVHEDDAKAAVERHRRVAEATAKGIAEIKHPERLAKVKEIGQQLEIYKKDADRLFTLRREQDKLTREILDPTGVKLRADLEQLQNWTVSKAGNTNTMILAGEAIKQLMMARLNVNKLLGRHEQAAEEMAVKAFADLKTAMTGFGTQIVDPEVRKLFDGVNVNVDRYTEAFKKAAYDSHEVEKLLNGTMRAAAGIIDKDAQFVRDSAIADEKVIEKELHATADMTEKLILVLGLVGLAIGGVLAWIIGRAISVPTRAIGVVLDELSKGNKMVDVPYADRGDEVGDNARAALTFKENLLRIEKMEAEQREQEVLVAQRRKEDMHRLADQFQAAVGGIVDTVSSASTELEAAANSLTSTAETTQTLSSAVAAASEEASTNVQSVASATEEMSASVSEIARQVQESSDIAKDAVRQAAQTDARINELSQAATRIGDVVALISAVAQQTNLLALNATIEAARAGEAGKGFAVVAQEVKALAAQTAKATEEISTQIASMQSATQDSVVAIKGISDTINRISEIASTIAAAVEEQGAATQEISRNVQEAAVGTTQVASNITQVNSGASETGTASSQVLSSAQSLSSESNHLKVEVDKFLATVRAA
jgi:methyl-accepting chemotaxis protein